MLTMQPEDTTETWYCRKVERTGDDQYRIFGTMMASSGSGYLQFDLAADGTTSNAVRTLLPSPHGPQQGGTTTPDGGRLWSFGSYSGGIRQFGMVKTDAQGGVEWARVYPECNGIFLATVERSVVARDGDYFFLGHLQDVPSGQGWASILLRTNGSGEEIATWVFDAGDYWSDRANTLLTTASNGLVAVTVQNPAGSQSSFQFIVVRRWNAELELEWSYRYSYGNYHEVSFTRELADGGLLIGGQVQQAYQGTFSPFLLRTDSTGQVVWSRIAEDTAPEPISAIEEPDGTFTMLYRVMVMPFQPAIGRIGADGALLEASWVEGEDTLMGFGSELVGDSTTPERAVRMGSGDQGRYIKFFRIGGDGSTTCGNESLSWTDASVLPVRTDRPTTFTSLTLPSESLALQTVPGGYLATLLCVTTSVAGKPSLDDGRSMVLAPNPAHAGDGVTVCFDRPRTDVRVSLVDVAGRVVAEHHAPSATEVAVPLHGVSSGIYMVVAHFRDGRAEPQRLVVH